MSLKQKCPICSKDICDCSWHCTCNPNEIISFFFRKRMEQIKNQQYIDPIYAIEAFRFANKKPSDRKTNSIPKVELTERKPEVVITTPWSSIRKWIK